MSLAVINNKKASPHKKRAIKALGDAVKTLRSCLPPKQGQTVDIFEAAKTAANAAIKAKTKSKGKNGR